MLFIIIKNLINKFYLKNKEVIYYFKKLVEELKQVLKKRETLNILHWKLLNFQPK